MTRRPTEELVEALSRDLAPVRRIPPLRVALCAAVGLWLVALGADAWLGGSAPFSIAAGRLADPAYAVILFGLLLAAVAGALGALAGAVPGRERSAARALRLVALGLGTAVVVGAIACMGGAEIAGGRTLRCAGRSAAIALAPLLAIGVFAARAWPRRALRVALLGSLGAVALGAVSVHASCAATSPLHALLGHALGPVALGLALALPVAWGLRRAAAS